MNDLQCEVVVIGGGAAGLAAGRALKRAGVDCLVLEAQERVGGRTLSRRLTNGITIDVGGQWVAPQQTRVVSLLEELGLETFPSYDEGDVVSFVDGVFSRSVDPIDLDDPVVQADVREGYARLEAVARSIPLDSPWSHPSAAELDRMSFAEWVDSNLATERGRWRLRYLGPCVFSVDATELSMLHVAFYFGAAGGVGVLTTTSGGGQDRRFTAGMQQLCIGMAKELGPRVLLNHVVSHILQTPDTVEVITDRQRIHAGRVIVALPPAMAARVRFTPPLPAARDLLHQRSPMGTAIKMMAVYARPFWRERGLSGMALTDRDVAQLLYDNSPADASCGILLGFTEGIPARHWIQRSPAEREAEFIRTAVGCFGPEAASPLEFVEMSWMEQEFTRGCYAGVMPPGLWTTVRGAVREPIGRIHWAGTETATDWPGYVEGALQSGERAAAETQDALQRERAHEAQDPEPGESRWIPPWTNTHYRQI